MRRPTRPTSRTRRPILEPLERRQLLSTALPPTTITLTQDRPVFSANQPITLTATVTTPDPAAPAPTGTVAFLEPLTSVPDPSSYLGLYTPYVESAVTYFDPLTQSSRTAILLGTAPLDATGVATLSLDSFPAPDAGHTGRFQALFLGGDAPALSLARNAPLLHPANGQSVRPTLGPGANSAYVTHLVFPDNRFLYFTAGGFTAYDSPAPHWDPILPRPMTFNSGPGHIPSSGLFAPTDTPLLVHSSVSRDTYFYPGQISYSTTVTPLPAFAGILDTNPNFQSSVSPFAILGPDVATSLDVRTSAHTPTYTNPPTFAVSIMDLAGANRLSRSAPATPARGSIQSASATLTVLAGGVQYGTATTIGGGTYYGGGSYGGTMTHSGHWWTAPPFVAPGPFLTGSVSFFDGSTLLATVPLDSLGNATFTPEPRSLSLGSHQIRIEYSGDDNYLPAQFTTAPFTIAQAATTLSLSTSNTTLTAGSNFSLTATVSTASPDTLAPTGTVTFSDGRDLSVTVPLGDTSSLYFNLPAGTHTLTASYSGDADFLPSAASQTFTLTVAPGGWTPPGTVYPPGTWTPPVWDPPTWPRPILIPSDPYWPIDWSIKDYAVDSVTFDSTLVRAGGQLGVRTSTSTTGGRGLESVPVALFLSTDDVAGNADDIPLGAFTDSLFGRTFLTEVDGRLTLAPDYTATLPADLPAGTYRLFLKADPDDSLTETDESNNTLFSSETITVYQPTIAASLKTPATQLKTGKTTKLSLTLSNTLAKSVRYKYAVKYYFSTDAELSDDDVQFSSQILDVSLGRKQSRTFDLSYTLPASIPLESGYVLAVGDRTRGASAVTRIQAASKPLTFTGPRLAAVIQSAKPGKTPTTSRVTVRLSNTGTTPHQGPITLSLFAASPDPTTPVLTVKKTLNLKPGKTLDLTFTLNRTPITPFSVTLA